MLDLEYNAATNYAWGGALTDNTNVNSKRASDPTTIWGFSQQIENYTKEGNSADPDALYIVWIGGNNFGELSTEDDPMKVEALVGAGISDTVTGVGSLASFGAKNILVIGLPDLGLTPYAITKGFQTSGTGLSTLYNNSLQLSVRELGIPIAFLDAATIMQTVLGEQTAPQFSNVTEACLNIKEVHVCDDPGNYAFWDDIHPSTAMHKILTNYVFATVAEPKFNPSTLLVHLPAIDILDETGQLSFSVDATLQYEPANNVLILTNYQPITNHSRVAKHAVYTPATNELIGEIQINEINYEFVLTLDTTSEVVQFNLIILEVIE